MKNAITTTATCAIGYLIGWGILLAMSNVLNVVPLLETKFWPVFTFTQPVSAIYRDKDKFCWEFHLKKRSPGVPIKYEFRVQPSNSPKIALAVYVANAEHQHRHGLGLETHPEGSEWTRYYCADLPSQTVDWEGFTVSGQAYHRRHPFWDSVTTLPDFYVPPLNENSLLQGAHKPAALQSQTVGSSPL